MKNSTPQSQFKNPVIKSLSTPMFATFFKEAKTVRNKFRSTRLNTLEPATIAEVFVTTSLHNLDEPSPNLIKNEVEIPVKVVAKVGECGNPTE